MTTKTRKTILEPNLSVFVEAVASAVRDGWELDAENPAIQYGVMYEVHVLKDSDLVAPPAPSRAEILANARAEKARLAAVAKAEADALEAAQLAAAQAEADAAAEAAQAPAGVDADGVLSEDVAVPEAPAEVPSKA